MQTSIATITIENRCKILDNTFMKNDTNIQSYTDDESYLSIEYGSDNLVNTESNGHHFYNQNIIWKRFNAL